jgi:hypothetical protein
VLESTNGGETFSPYRTLSLPAKETEKAVHIDAPHSSRTSDFTILAQITDAHNSSIQELLCYHVPIDVIGTSIA